MNAVIYARYSSSGQRDESIEGQIRDCSEYAASHGYNIIKSYTDKALTGRTDKRPGFQSMIKDAEKGFFEIILCWKNDRFARNRYDAAIYKAKLKKCGVKVEYAKEFIPEGPEGIILESMMEGYAEYYSANLSQNVKRGMYDSALELKTLGKTPFGYRRGADGKFELDPDAAPVVRRIFDEYAAGRPARDIAADLEREGYKTSKNAASFRTAIPRILKNEKYTGIYRYEDIEVEGGIPPIISKDTFAKCNKMLDLHHRSPNAKKDEGKGFILTGKLFCGECGSPMIGDGGTSHTGQIYSYYTCNGRKAGKCKKCREKKEAIETEIIEALFAIVNDDDIINDFADRYMDWQSKQDIRPHLDALRQELAEVSTAQDRLIDAVTAGFYNDKVKAKMEELDARKAELDAALAEAQISTPIFKREDVVFFLMSFRDGDIDSPEWRLFFVETFLRRAWVFDNGEIRLKLNFSGDKSEVTLPQSQSIIDGGNGSTFDAKGAPFALKLNLFDFGIVQVLK